MFLIRSGILNTTLYFQFEICQNLYRVKRLRLRLSLLRIAYNIVAMACVRPLRPLRPVRPLPVAPARSLDLAAGLLPGRLRRLSRGFCAAARHALLRASDHAMP